MHSSLKWSDVRLLSPVRLCATPWTVAHQALPSMGFSRQEYWSGLPFPSPGELPDLGIKHCRSPALQAGALPSEPPGKPTEICWFVWSIWKNSSVSHICVRKWSNIIVFSNNVGYSFLIPQKTSARSSFLKVSYNIKSETVSMSFLYFITLKSYIKSYIKTVFLEPWNGIAGRPMCDFVILYVDFLENIGSLYYLLNVDTLVTKCFKNHTK